MKYFQVTALCATINGGTLALSPAQYAVRKHNLKDEGNGRYTVLSSVQFKRGEQFGHDGDVNKAILQDVELLGEDEEEAEDDGEGDEEGKSGQQPPPAENAVTPPEHRNNANRRNRGR